jgi:beta-glucosidase
VKVLVKNTGAGGGEVVEVYTGHLPTSVTTQNKQLAGFAKVWLKPGRRQYVTARLGRRALSYRDTASDRWVTPAGDVPIYADSSSRDIPLTLPLTLP